MARGTRGAGIALPRHGHALVTITAMDANGFVHHFETIETPVASLREGVAVMQIQSPAMVAAHREAMSA